MLRQTKGFSLPEGYRIIYELLEKANYFFTGVKKFFRFQPGIEKFVSSPLSKLNPLFYRHSAFMPGTGTGGNLIDKA